MIRGLRWPLAAGLCCLITLTALARTTDLAPGLRQPKGVLPCDPLGPPAYKGKIQHFAPRGPGDLVTETDHFRVVSKDKARLMARIATEAENARLSVHAKWFGDRVNEWDGKATIYLYSSHKRYLERTGLRFLAHTQVRMGKGEGFSRSISLPCDVPKLFEDVLPHEVTHTVMALRFCGSMPRWADEGTASLSESPASIMNRRRVLAESWNRKTLFSMEVLMTTEEEQHLNSLEYYAQAMSLMEFFVAAKGPRTFMRFLMDSCHKGYETSLKQYYKVASLEELHRHWQAFAFSALLQDGLRPLLPGDRIVKGLVN